MHTRAWHGLILLSLAGALLMSGAVQGQPVTPDERLGASQPSLSLVGSIQTGIPASVVVTCGGYNCSREHGIVYYDLDADEVRFSHAQSLEPAAQSISAPWFGDVGPLLHDPFHNQVYAFSKYTKCDGWGTNCYEQVWLQILADGEQKKAVPINDAFNTPEEVDHFYSIGGVAIKPHGIGISGRTTFVVNDVPNQNLDIVHMQPNGKDVGSVERYSYGESLCSESLCDWHENYGNSLALDYRQGMLYLADNNRDWGHVQAFRFSDSVNWEAAPINIHQHALCFVAKRGLEVAQGQNTLYAPTGCQSFETGSMVLVDTESDTVKDTLYYDYLDQGIVEVDTNDPRRAFITTSDSDGTYDPEQWLILHMLYDDVIVASLPLFPGYNDGFDRRLRDIYFDPTAHRLYLAVNQQILVVDVGGVPPAEFWPPPVTATITPDHGGTVAAGDGSAELSFPADAVDQTSLVTYAEGPPRTQRTLAAETTLHPIREFALTAVISDTGTTIDSFAQPFTLNAETTARERAGTISGSLALYWWDGSAWIKQSTVSTDPFYATSTQTGHFALMGESYPIYLPLVQR